MIPHTSSVEDGHNSLEDENVALSPSTITEHFFSSAARNPDPVPSQPYKLYKRRFAGLFGLFVLNVVAAMGWPWFGPIGNNTSAEFDITLDQVNWLGNIVCCVYVPAIFFIPWIVSKYGVQRCCHVGAVSLLLAAWIRYAGTVRSLSGSRAYALLIIGQFFSAIAQAIYQVLAPKYSELWFSLSGRTTATMIVAISNPIGGAVGQLLSPLLGTTRHSILILAIISSAALPSILLIGDKPPTPPTHSAAQKSRSASSLFLNLVGKQKQSEVDLAECMSSRERLDLVIVVMLFGMFVAAINTFSIISAQDLEPYGYSSDTAGFMGATLLLAGIVAAIFTAPLFDHVLTKHLALTVKVLVPIMAALWLSLIWAIRPNNAAALYAIFALIGMCSLTLLPVALELGVELTRAADASSALLWGAGNLFTVMFILSESALRAGPDASPPLNMHKGFILQAAILCVMVLLIIPFKGEQKRRRADEQDIRNVKDATKVDVQSVRAGRDEEEGGSGSLRDVDDRAGDKRDD